MIIIRPSISPSRLPVKIKIEKKKGHAMKIIYKCEEKYIQNNKCIRRDLRSAYRDNEQYDFREPENNQIVEIYIIQTIHIGTTRISISFQRIKEYDIPPWTITWDYWRIITHPKEMIS